MTSLRTMAADTASATATRCALTLDVDWAPDAVLADAIALVDEAGVACTVFATHPTPVLDGLDRSRFEIALHPNLNRALAGEEDFRRPIDALRAAFPEARGVRSHGLVYGGLVADYLATCGFAWESNLFVPFHLAPFREHNALLRIPFGWSDGWTLWAGEAFGDPRIAGAAPGAGVFLFHPVHLFLNTDVRTRYERARPVYHDPSRLAALRNVGRRAGARDAWRSLLETVSADGLPTTRLSDLAELCP